jgi:hypothetical protein
MATSWSWHYETLAPMDRGAGEGERWKLYDLDSNLVMATVVKFPGRVFRIYWNGGGVTDCSTTYLTHAELRMRLHDDEIPKLTNRSDALHTPHV